MESELKFDLDLYLKLTADAAGLSLPPIRRTLSCGDIGQSCGDIEPIEPIEPIAQMDGATLSLHSVGRLALSGWGRVLQLPPDVKPGGHNVR